MKMTTFMAVLIPPLLAGSWFFGWGKPLRVERSDLYRQILAEQKKLATYRQALDYFNSEIDEFRRMNMSSGRSALPFSGENEIIGLYESLDSLCHQPGYRLEEITPSLEETIRYLRQWANSDTTLSMPIRIKINAHFRSLTNLIEAVERHRDFSRMDDCRIYASEKLYPNCLLDLTFIAGLGNRMELFGLE